MKTLLTILLLCASLYSYSQQNSTETFIQTIKKNAKIDKNDKVVYNLLNDFYIQGLQSDTIRLDPQTLQKIRGIYADTTAKNIHILTLFLTYQEHISKTVAIGKQADTNLQISLMEALELETAHVYNEVPVIVYIYKAEALNSAGKKTEAAEVVSQGLKQYPSSIPLKVYYYLNTKDEAIKTDLIANHPNHWMVKNFGLK